MEDRRLDRGTEASFAGDGDGDDTRFSCCDIPYLELQLDGEFAEVGEIIGRLERRGYYFRVSFCAA